MLCLSVIRPSVTKNDSEFKVHGCKNWVWDLILCKNSINMNTFREIHTDVRKSVYTAETGDGVEDTEVVLPLLLLLLLLLLLIASFASLAHSGRVSMPLTRLPPNFIVACNIPPDPKLKN